MSPTYQDPGVIAQQLTAGAPGGGGVSGAGDPNAALDNLFGFSSGSNILGAQVNNAGPTTAIDPGTDNYRPVQRPSTVIPGLGSTFSVQDLLQNLAQLPPDQLREVQSELFNAGYYGPINKPADEPSWGTLTGKDASAMKQFALDAVRASQSGSNISSLLAARDAQFATQQAQTHREQNPVLNLGKDYEIKHLDTAFAKDVVDKVGLKVWGKQPDEVQRTKYSAWLDQHYTASQIALMNADINRRLSDSQAKAQFSGMIDPQTGQPTGDNQVVALARQMIGIPYQWGGKNPASGLDCSGLTQWVYGRLGVDIGGGAAQWTNPGISHFTDQNQAQPGDLVFYGAGNSDPAHMHVGIYIGNGMMIDAPHTGASVRIDSVQGMASATEPFSYFGHVNALGQMGNQISVNAGGVATPTGGPPMNRGDWAVDVLRAWGKPVTTSNVAAMIAWQMREGGHWSDGTNSWNPLNTMETGAGGVVGKFGAGISKYDSARSGIANTVRALNNGRYGDINAAFAGGDASNALANANGGLSTWSGGGYGALSGLIGQSQQEALRAVAGAGSNTFGLGDGKTIVSTPDQVVDTTNFDEAAMQSELEAQMRLDDPQAAQTHDFGDLYDMFTKVLHENLVR